MRDEEFNPEMTMASSQYKKEKEYWLNKLSGNPVKTTFPYDSGGIDQNSTHGGEAAGIRFRIPGELFPRLIKVSGKSDFRLHMILVAGLVTLLHRYTGSTDIIVGAPVVVQNIRARFINTLLILRHQIENDMSFKDILMQVKQTIIEATENVNYPVRMLLHQLKIPLNEDEFPLFDVMVLLENIHDKEYIRDIRTNTVFSFHKADDYLEGAAAYNPRLFEKTTMEKIILHFNILLEQVLFDVDIKVAAVDLLAEEEKKQLMDFNRTRADYPGNRTICELFDRQVEKTPHGIAVRTTAGTALTYRELNRQVGQLARQLRENGVKTGAVVALELDCSIETVVAVQAVLKAGGAYLPIDPAYPAERKVYLLEDSRASLLLIRKGAAPPQWGGKVIHLDLDIKNNSQNKKQAQVNTKQVDRNASPADLAYIIYTSGSTGRPKGVMVEHRGLVNYIWWAAQKYVKDKKTSFPLYSSLSFDLTVTSLFTPLITGNAIEVYEGENKELLIKDIIHHNNVEAIKLTPAHLELIREMNIDGTGSRLKCLIVGGEELPAPLARSISECFGGNIEICNEYGPTETVVGCMHYIFNPAVDKGRSVPIGAPAHNVRIHILDENHMPLPPGAVGEIFIAGDGVARGYLNQPGLTAEKFVEDPFCPKKNSRMYKSGDLGRWLRDNCIEFLGRKDQQVKIRGFRIELGEIENQLVRHPGIKAAVVLGIQVKPGEDQNLCAYVLPVPGNHADEFELREYLSQRLPVYMIPSFFREVETIPLTPNGKVNRKALPPIEIKINTEQYKAPRNPEEQVLVKIWQEVLGEKIGIKDNFFMKGGDSIKAIQVVSRVTGYGYKIEVGDLFKKPQIEQLAPLMKKTERTAHQGTVRGIVPLTPIQQWFFEHNEPGKNHFNQAVLLYSRERPDEETIKAVFVKLQEHHDALRMTYQTDNGKIIQVNQGLDYPCSFQVFDYNNQKDTAAAIANKANEIQASINLETGPLMKVALFHLPDGDRLLIVIHHLVIDGVSWRILFADIETLLQRYKNGEPLELPLKTDSFKMWSEKLSQYADSESFLKEKAYWAQLESLPVPGIEKDLPGEDNHVIDTKNLSFRLSETETNLFLTKVNEAFGTDHNDILLTALGLSLEKTWGHHRFLVSLEGHGREEILENMDISRTIGWFTTIYPVILDISYENDLSRQIKEIKETLRRVPNKGIGYGILEYLTKEENRKDIHFKLNPRVNFNYLGQFDADIRQKSFEIAKESYGNTRSPHWQRTSDIEISGIISSAQLVVTVAYNKKHYKPETMQTFLDNYKEKLADTISYCVSRRERQLTPSDFTYPGLSIEMVEQLARQYPIEDIYILSPMQEGKLFYTFYNQSSSGGSVQITISISGNLDLSLFERSINELFTRYDILRAAFVSGGVNVPIQIILKERQVEFLYRDLREKITKENKQSLIDQFAERDRMRSFDLGKHALMRTTVLQTGNSDYELLWSFHHILMDGWCVGILIEEFLNIYNHPGENILHQLPPVTPYREYIRWLMKQDKKEPEAYWKKYLEGFEKETSLLKKKGVKRDQKNYQFEREHFYLSEDKTSALYLLAAESQVTVNTIIQALWGILLSKYNQEEDVVFGAVVSGRPSEIPGVESMVGLFINTIPVRISLKREITFAQLIRRVQEKAIESEPYHYYPLSRIQAGSILKRNLLNHILVFENYPLVEQVQGIAERTRNKAFDVLKVTEYTQPDYNFHVVIHPGNTLWIEFRFNSLVYDGDFVKEIALHVEEITNAILHDKDTRLENIGISDERVKTKFSDQGNYTADFGF